MPSITIPSVDREVFETLVKSIYTDPVKASVREIIANASDANKEGNAGRPIEVYFDFDSTVVRDFGMGMSPNLIESIFSAMYKSTKRSDDENEVTNMDGEFGIGSKAPYGVLYTIEQTNSNCITKYHKYDMDYYTMKTVHGGVAYLYILMLNADGIPSYELVHSYQSDEHSGTEVTVPVTFTSSPKSERFKDLIGILAPYYICNEGNRSVEIGGNHKILVNNIKKLLNNSFIYDNILNIDYSIFNTKPPQYSVSFKYKNIIYPDLSYYSNNRLIQERVEQIYLIDESELDAPLPINRSRDRIDDDGRFALSKHSEIFNAQHNLEREITQLIHDLLECSTIKNTVKRNFVVSTLAKDIASYGPALDGKITTYINKGLLPENYDYNTHTIDVFLDIIQVKDSDKVFSDFEKRLGITKDMVYRWISKKDDFKSIPNIFDTISYFEKDCATTEFITQVHRRSLHIHELVVPNTTKVEFDIARIPMAVGIEPSSSVVKKHVNRLLGDKTNIFVIKDMNKGFKVPSYLLRQDEDYKDYTIIMISCDLDDVDDLCQHFRTDGITNFFKISDLVKKYKNEIDDIKEQKRRKRSSPKSKRIRGIHLVNTHDNDGDFGYSSHHDINKKTMQSNDITRITRDADAVYVVRLDNKRFSHCAYTNDGNYVRFNFSSCEYGQPFGRDISMNITSYNKDFKELNKRELIQDSFTRLLPVGGAVIVCDSEHYDKIHEFIDNDKIIFFEDYFTEKVNAMNLINTIPVNMMDIKSASIELVERERTKLNNANDIEESRCRDNISVLRNIMNFIKTMKTLDMIDIAQGRVPKDTNMNSFDGIVSSIGVLDDGGESLLVFKKVFDTIQNCDNFSIVKSLLNMVNFSAYIPPKTVVEMSEVVKHIIDLSDIEKVLKDYLTI